VESIFRGRAKSTLESALRPFLTRHRWFAGKARTIQRVDSARFSKLQLAVYRDLVL
jgi:hypothetical protein